MSNRAIAALVLLMCASFAAVLATMWSAFVPPRSARPAVHDRRILRAPPPIDEENGARPGAASRAHGDKTRRPSPSHLDAAVARPLPRQQLSAAEEVERLDEAELRQRARNAADLATRHLDGMASRLERQIEALEQSRNGLLDELARELQDMEPGAAARELALLDDESAALALRRLPPAFRTQVLGALEPTRRRALRSQLNSLKDN